MLSKDYASQYINISALFMSIGIIFFSGSLYALTLSGTKWLGIVTPIGGLCFLIAWFTLALNFILNKI